MKTVFFTYLITPLLISFCLALNNCKPEPIEINSPADKIAGKYIGTGKYLPGNIDLGNTLSCMKPVKDYNSFYISGNVTINVIKVNDTTVNLQIALGLLPQTIYSLTVKEKLNTIVFNQGYYDVNTKIIQFAGTSPNFSYWYSKNCKLGLPYFTTVILPGPISNFEYVHQTIERYEFGGVKQ